MDFSLQLLATVLGAIGGGIVVLSYLLLTFEKLKVNITYHCINLVAAIALFVSLLVNFNLGSFIIECFWIGTSCIGIVRELLKGRKVNEQQQA